MATNRDYLPGQEAFYHETGDIYKVKVLETKGDEKWERYKLKVLEIIASEGPTYHPEIGEEFPCEKLRDVSAPGLWHLLDR